MANDPSGEQTRKQRLILQREALAAKLAAGSLDQNGAGDLRLKMVEADEVQRHVAISS